MKDFKATYHNAATGKTSTMISKAASLAEAIRSEEASMAMFKRTSPHLSLISVEAI